jgi:hypothetical protein
VVPNDSQFLNGQKQKAKGHAPAPASAGVFLSAAMRATGFLDRRFY